MGSNCSLTVIISTRPQRAVPQSEGVSWTSWFDIRRSPPYIRDDESEHTAVSFVEDLILAEMHAGLDSSRIILVGFGLGAALSMMVALTTLHDLGGVACLSGWIPYPWRQVLISLTLVKYCAKVSL